MTLQQRFDKAMALAGSGDCINAVPLFEELKLQRAFRPETLGGAMVLVHEGSCLVRIGLFDLGESYIEQGLPIIRKSEAQFKVDIAAAVLALGDVAMSRWEYSRAKTLYLEAAAMGEAVHPLTLNTKLAMATAFDGGPEPLRYADEAIRLAQADPALPKSQLAGIRTIRGRILMNQGQDKEAYSELKRALTASGGLDLKVDRADIALRSELAVAAQLTGDTSGARDYLFYTGAGRLKAQNLGSALSMEPPVCGTESGLRPEDFAIVEVAISDEGRVARAETVYTRGTAQVAAQFARAARNWAWDATSIKATPQVFRHAAHIEVRCTTMGQQVPGLTAPWDSRFTTWAARTLGPDIQTVNSGEGNGLLTKLKTLAGQPEVMSDGLKKAAIEGWLILLQPVTFVQLDSRLEGAQAAARGANAPPEVVTWLRIRQVHARVIAQDLIKGMPQAKTSDLLALLKEPDVANDALAANTVRLLAGAERDGRRQVNQWSDLLKDVAGDDRLAPHHPLRQLANLSLANEAARQKDFAEADRFFRATGLTEEQCALIGPRPVMKKVGLQSNDYPSDAVFNQFEGWLRLEFDILADGRTNGVRPILAYPPFIFNRAGVDGIKTSRFEASYRPEGGAACSASRQGIVFRLPG